MTSQVLALCTVIVRNSHLPWKQSQTLTCSYKPGSLTLPPSAKHAGTKKPYSLIDSLAGHLPPDHW